MPNIFDQFDTPIPTIAPDGKNPFDAFDGNVFDQFDEPVPLKFANLPGNTKLNPLQQVQLQTRLQDPENPTGQDNTFLTALSEGGSPLAFAKNLATLPFVLPISAVSESIKPFAAPIMNALADVGEADTPIVQPKGEPSGADVVLYQLGLGKKPDNYQPDDFFQPGQPMLPKELFPYADENQRGILPAATRALLGMSTPENALLAGAAPLAPEAIGGGFFAGTVASIPDSLQRLATARNGEDFKDAATELGLNVGMAVLMAHGLIPKPGPVMTPEEAAANRAAVLASLPPGFEKSANSALPPVPVTTTDGAQGPAPEPNATNPLLYEQLGTPNLQNKDDLEAVVQNLQNILRGKLPPQEQQTVNNPSDKADEIIRNVFPAEGQRHADITSALQSRPTGQNAANQAKSYPVQTAAMRAKLAHEQGIARDNKTLTTSETKAGRSANSDYRATFFAAHPALRGRVVVHHAVEQQVLTRYPRTFTKPELHSIANLRGIPKEINSDLHLSQIRREWNRFNKAVPNPTHEQFSQQAAKIDAKYGSQFLPPVQ